MQCDGSRAIISNDYLDYITDYVLEEDEILSSEFDYCTIDINELYRVNYVNRRNLPELRVSSYYYGIPKLYGLVQNTFDVVDLNETGIFQVQQPPLSLTGKGVLIGFIDTGIRYTLDAFRDLNGNTRIESIWDQSIEMEQKAPEGFFYGSEFTREEINRALQAENPREVLNTWDEIGHGTQMALIAAGKDPTEGGFVGAAPDSDILVVKLKQAKPYLREFYLVNEEAQAYQENDIMLGCKYLLQYARVFSRPLVIVLGVGTNLGDHAGNSPLARYLEELNSRRNVAVVVAAGNEGNANHHYLGDLKRNQENIGQLTEVYESVEIRVGEGERGFCCELWGISPDVYEVGIVSPGGERIPRIRFNYQESLEYSFVYESTRVNIDIVLVEELSSQELIFLRFIDPTPGVWTIYVYHQGVLNSGIFHMWLPITLFLNSATYFLSPNPYTTITEPGMAQNVFTVGAYNSETGAFAFFSGRGNNRLGYPKPALVAPGIAIRTPIGEATGTSIAAAFTAGAVADFMEWAVIRENAPLVSGLGIRGYFVQGAARQNEVVYHSRLEGYGRLDLEGVFNKLRR